MAQVTVKPGVTFDKDGKAVIKTGGFKILGAIEFVAQELGVDLVITSGTDGKHSGPNDPHYRGEAYDVRSNNLTAEQKAKVVARLTAVLGPKFYAFLEAPNTVNEHIHIQVAKGKTYP